MPAQNNNGYFNELKKFLADAETDTLKTNSYLNKYLGLNVKVSFGQGYPARIPWIAFLNEIDSVSEGIYPVYLYYKKKKLLILAYGVSETNPPPRTWDVQNASTIKQYFSKNYNEKPERYGDSFVFKVYDTNFPLNEEDINKDLIAIINKYKSTYDINKSSSDVKEFAYQKFHEDILNAGLLINKKTCLRFIASLLTKPFVILTGLSGSGKTKIAQAFATWLSESENQYCIVPVGADWTNREPLLGFPNGLKENGYVKPDNKALDIIIDASKNPEKPFFLILDEMNLSHVERYFADFLSVMESKSKISLHTGREAKDGVPPEISFPQNLFIIGTVNVDETTNMFSPKVLDRANTIEFRVHSKEMTQFLNGFKQLKIESLAAAGAEMAKSFLQHSQNKGFQIENGVNETLMLFFSDLQKAGAEFGYRSATEIVRLMYWLGILDNTITKDEKLDIAIIQKLLPKLHGSRRKLSGVLATLGAFCINGDSLKIEKDIFDNEGFDYNSDNVKYPLTLEKIARMYKGAVDNGFTSFAEA